MDRFWLLTWTTYGTWLPGNVRGFVSPVQDQAGKQVIHNIPETPYDRDIEALQRYSERVMKETPRYLKKSQSEIVFQQLQETAKYRGWEIVAIAIMWNHVHVVVGVPGDPDPSELLRDFKSYASRALNREQSMASSDRWWTESGSKRKLPEEEAIVAAIRYVENQRNAHVVWIAEQFRR